MRGILGLAGALVWVVGSGIWGQAGSSATPQAATRQAAPAGTSKSCAVAKWEPGDADKALNQGKFEDAERLFAAMPASSAATAGVVRAQLGERKFDEALALITKETAAHPNDALLEDVLGEVRFRRGEVEEGAVAYNTAMKLDPCSARTHYDVGRYMNLNGLYASAQKQLEVAHKLAPDDPMIRRTWEGTQQAPVTAEERIARLQKREAADGVTEEQKKDIENTIKAIRAREKGDCELATPVETAKIAMASVYPSQNSQAMARGSGVDVYLNGKRRRFLLDTGASGIVLTREAAKALGLETEAEGKSFGFGDNGMRNDLLAHVDEVRMGGLTFHNCMVRILEDKNVLGTDGLLGADVFRSFVVTLDFPAHEIRLGPLPKLPDETTAAPVSLGTGGDAGGEGQAVGEMRKDRYVAPEMKDWTRVFRSNHHLIFETSIGNAPHKLFVMDTGASETLISPAAAREVTRVSNEDEHHVKGISGEVKKVSGADRVMVAFARVRQETVGMTAIDMTNVSRGMGVEISGFLGYPLLRELVIQIDYRDNLVHVSYTPHVETGR